jgi:hypothetical protein
MDQFGAFYQELDSKALLDQHGPSLVADAKEILAAAPDERLAGTIIMPDSREAPAFREAIAKATGKPIAEGLVVGVCRRAMIEAVLTSRVGTVPWKEEPWQPQQVLPVVVATRDGFRFGFFRLDSTEAAERE